MNPGDRIAWLRPNGELTAGRYLGYTCNGQWGVWTWEGHEVGHVVLQDGEEYPEIIEEVEAIA